MWHRRRVITCLLGAAALAVAGCSSSASSGKTSGQATGAPTTTTVNVVAYPLLDFAPAWVADAQGYFKAEGLDVVFKKNAASNSSAAAALLASGQFQLAMASVSSVAQAHAHGVQLQVLAGATTLGGPGDHNIDIIASANGPASLKDLGASGKKIGVAGGQGSPTQVFVQNAIAQAGGDPTAPTFVAAPYPTMAGLLKNGSISAAAIIEPFRSAALADPNLRVLGSASGALPVGSPSLSWTTSAAFASANPGVVAKLQTALRKGTDWLNDPANHDQYIALAAQRSGQSADTLRHAALPTYSAALKQSTTTQFFELFVRYKQFAAAPDLAPLFTQGALTTG